MTTPASTPESDASTDPPPAVPAGARPGASFFTIEGRPAPALFVVGWLASLVGVGLMAIAVMANRGLASSVVLLAGLALLSVGLVAAAGSQGIERRARRIATYAGPSPLLVFAASLPVSILAGVLVVGLPFGLAGVATDGPFATLLAVALQAAVNVGLIRLLVVDTGALDWRAMGVRRPDRRALGEMAGGALWALPVIAVTAVLASALQQVFPVTPESPLPPTHEAVGFGLSLIAGALVAPFGEEILFRAFATTAWVRGVGVRSGVIRAALIFALAHILTISGSTTAEAFGLAVVGFGTRIPIALALGALFVRRGTVWSSFGLHASFNLVLLVVAEMYSRSV